MENISTNKMFFAHPKIINYFTRTFFFQLLFTIFRECFSACLASSFALIGLVWLGRAIRRDGNSRAR